MKLKDCIPGTKVLYKPVLGKTTRSFKGTVREHPWQLGHGTWVTHLTNMEVDYGNYVGVPGKKHVHAAYVEEALELDTSSESR